MYIDSIKSIRVKGKQELIHFWGVLQVISNKDLNKMKRFISIYFSTNVLFLSEVLKVISASNNNQIICRFIETINLYADHLNDKIY